MPRPLSESVVVITGASSGIARAAASMFAEEGARVVAVARRADALASLVDEISRAGGHALSVPADVTRPEDVTRVVDEATRAFGGIDVWVNAAAVGVVGRFEDVPPDTFRRVVDVVLHGTVNGTRAALPALRARGGGVLINVGSTIGKAPIPFMSAYEAAKAGVLAFSETLRLEGAQDGVHVCVVNPPSSDTPFYTHTANYAGRAAQAPQPAYPAETTARAIVKCATHPEREVNVGGVSKLQQVAFAAAPGVYEAVTTPYVERALLTEDAQAATDGNAFEPMPEGASTSGGYGTHVTGVRVAGGVAALAGVALVAAGWRAWHRNGHA